MTCNDQELEELFLLLFGRELTESDRNSIMSKEYRKMHDSYLEFYETCKYLNKKCTQNNLSCDLFKCAVACLRCALNWNFDAYGVWLGRLNSELRNLDELTMSGNELVLNFETREFISGDHATLKAADHNMHMYHQFNYTIPEMRRWDCAGFRD